MNIPLDKLAAARFKEYRRGPVITNRTEQGAVRRRQQREWRLRHLARVRKLANQRYRMKKTKENK